MIDPDDLLDGADFMRKARRENPPPQPQPAQRVNRRVVAAAFALTLAAIFGWLTHAAQEPDIDVYVVPTSTSTP